MDTKIKFLGVDIGGAHLKLVGLNQRKQIIYVSYLKCPIWEDLNNLKFHLFNLRNEINFNSILCCITMTAELCDCFENRSHGVKRIVSICKESGLNYLFFSSKLNYFTNKFLPNHVSSMNWLAPAIFLKKKIENGILIDLGSTTTDITIIKHSNLINKTMISKVEFYIFCIDHEYGISDVRLLNKPWRSSHESRSIS